MFDGDEYEDQLLGDPNQLDDLVEARDLNPLVDEEAADDVDDAEAEGQDQDKGEDNTGDKKKRRRILNPQPKLDAIRLTGPRGIATIEGLFKDFKFLGNGYEEQDLKRILGRLEVWGNRLFPKYQFDDLLDKIEKLGSKKPVMNFVNKIRLGMVTEDSVAEHHDDVIEDDDMDLDDMPLRNERNAEADDLFTRLLDEQLSQVESQQQQQIKPPPPQPEISEEQRQRMLQNRKLAEERRLARLKAQQERESNLEESSELNPPSPQADPCRSTETVEEGPLKSIQGEVAATVSEKQDRDDDDGDVSDAVVSLPEEQNNTSMEISTVPGEEPEGVAV
ncbi:TIMELESS-interacting protein [Ischnura elegans]|uniref:TIMELESS-interacting protein n=1 Tax=Ischnura elegans TaxID=197161 RepID=UPI001ED8A3B8|nr:TIMELESS-interacting protein [Ischnura elegans]XP_046402169.1 TIMELESS-interacting protein [Ischnura elegans]XP_046402170.1 TIMELESS-interacting protein [Ischnura elegans]